MAGDCSLNARSANAAEIRRALESAATGEWRGNGLITVPLLLSHAAAPSPSQDSASCARSFNPLRNNGTIADASSTWNVASGAWAAPPGRAAVSQALSFPQSGRGFVYSAVDFRVVWPMRADEAR
jgi:hypothetical protein